MWDEDFLKSNQWLGRLLKWSSLSHFIHIWTNRIFGGIAVEIRPFRLVNTDQRNGFRYLKRKGPFIQPKKHISKYLARKAKTYHFIGQYFAKKIVHNVATRLPFVSQWYTKHFPAVRLNHSMSPLEYGLNFSSEILVAILVVVVAGLNVVVFNPFSDSTAHQDKSLAAHLLRYHSSLNNQLAIKHNTVSTTVSGSNGFISQAFADQTGSVLGATDTIESEATEDGIEDNGINKANPDSIKKLVSRQVQIYETKPFDTVYTVARQFGVSTQTIRESNGLPDHALKAGWFLVIPPVDGLVLQITNPNVTLTDVADRYSADVNKIVSYNGLADAEDMVEMGDYLVVPGGKLPAPAPTPTPKTPTPTPTKKSSPSVPKATISGNHKFAPGYCTDYVARKVPGIKWGGNANRWIANSKAYGATVNRTPVAGAILVTNENSRYGHVAYIEKVVGTTVHFSEWNYAGLYKTTHRTMDISDRRIQGVIHPAR